MNTHEYVEWDMDGQHYAYEIVPTHFIVRFEGEVTVPTDNEDTAIYEVKKALNKMCDQFDIYGEDNKAPDYSLWIHGQYSKHIPV